MADANEELLELSWELLRSIDTQDWATYARLCDPSLSAYEPEGRGHLIEGLPFHRFYFDLQGSGRPRQSTISSPHIRVLGDTAVVTYIRLVQRVEADGSVPTVRAEETRVWHRQDGTWRHVHFHRSIPN